MEDYLGPALSSSVLAAVAIDEDARIVQCNEAFSLLTGQSISELIGQLVLNSIAAVDRDRVSDELEALRLGSVSTVTAERRINAASGSTQWCHLSAWKPAGTPTGLRVLLLKDIAARRDLQTSRRQIVEMLASARPASEILEAICLVGEKALGGARFAIFPVGDEAHAGSPVAPSISAELLAALKHSSIIESARAGATDSPNPGGASSAAFAEMGIKSVIAEPIHDAEGATLGVLAICLPDPMVWSADEIGIRDGCSYLTQVVLERSRKDETFAAKDQLTNAILESTSDCVKFLTLDARVEFINDPGLRALGICEFDSVKGADWIGFWKDEHAIAAAKAVEDARAGGVGRFQGFCPTFDGKPRWWDVSVTPVRGRDGRPRKLMSISRDISEILESEAARRENEERFRNLADNMSQFAWMSDSKGWTFWYNQRWYEYTGTTLEEMQGWGWQKVHHPDHLERVMSKIKHCWNTGEAWEDTFPLRSKDGIYRWFLSRAIPIRDAQGNVVRWFGTNTDITELRERDAALSRSNADLRQFVHMASHDLQEPLRAMVSYSQLLARSEFVASDAKARGFLNTIVEAGRRMTTLLRDLLAYAQASADAEQERSPIDLAQIVRDVMQESRAALEEAGATMTIGSLPVVLGNEAALYQVVQNLVSNSIKYRRPSVPLEIRIDSVLHEDEWSIQVEDNGSGFEPEQAEYIFGIFRRLHGREVPGTGLGLAIVRSVVERHGGRIWARGRRDAGATFILALPRAGAVQASQAASVPSLESRR